jgi:signal transduction histidine kinase
MIADYVPLLQRVFPGMDDTVLSDLAAMVRERTYPAGTVLCHEGQVESTFYIVKAGQVEVTKHLEGDVSRVLNHHGPGEFFGEIALIQNSRRVASVRTTEETTVLELDKSGFDEFLDRSPAVGLALMRQVAARLRSADQASIAELRRVNQQLADAYANLERQERQRSEFLTTVAHELRTPLTVAKGYLQLMRAGAIPGVRGESVETVYRHVDKVVHLVNNILFMQEMSLIDLDFEPVSLGDVLTRVVEANRPHAHDRDVQLRVDCPIQPPLVPGDIEGLVTSINGIVDNAIKFSHFGGEVVLRLGQTADGSRVMVEIEDHGPGIAPEMQERIFERYKGDAPGAPTAGGLGLGLPIAKYLIERHGGTLRVRSVPGQGATFVMTLPVQRGEGPVL